MKLNVDEELLALMVTAIGRQRQSKDWIKDSGQYIPHPATWLNGRRWEDEFGAVADDDSDKPAWALAAGFTNRFDAENAGCNKRNATSFNSGNQKEFA